eukprot:PhM_4_TR11525/c0_g3_i1/m.92851
MSFNDTPTNESLELPASSVSNDGNSPMLRPEQTSPMLRSEQSMSDALKPEQSMSQKSNQSVRVVARVRPFSATELADCSSEPTMDDGEERNGPTSVVFMDSTKVTVLDPQHNYQSKETFLFDNVYWSIPDSQNQYSECPFADQNDVYLGVAQPLVPEVLDGFNCSILAYGQTGSGKTHTMLGNDADPGIAPRVIDEIYTQLADARAKGHASVEVSFMEIYNEKVRDLLGSRNTPPNKKGERHASVSERRNSGSASPKVGPTDRRASVVPGMGGGGNVTIGYQDCRVRHHPELGTFVDGLRREIVEDPEKCKELLKFGLDHRATAPTKMNDVSSRSHAILQITVKQKFPTLGTQRVSVLHIVDLAGSEKIRRSGVTGGALTEAKTINLSLSTLRRVIDILIENETLPPKRRGIPPYRESMLTWVLSDSLGGNSKTTMIATVSPHISNLDDTIASLRYALKAKAIVCHAKVNEQRTAVVVSALRNEIEAIKQQMTSDSVSTSDTERKRAKEELEKLEADYQQAEETHKHLQEEGAELKAQVEATRAELETVTTSLESRKRDAEDLTKIAEERLKAAEEELLQKKRSEELERFKTEHEVKRAQEEANIQKLDTSHTEAAKRAAEVREAEIKFMQAKYANVFKRVTRLTRDHKMRTRLQVDVENVRAQVAEFTLSHEKDRRRIEAATAERDDLLNQLRLWEEKVATIQRDHEVQRDSLIKQEQSLVDELQTLEDKFAHIQSQLMFAREKQTAAASHRENTNNSLSDECRGLQAEYDSLSVQNAEIDMHIQRLTQEIAHKRAKYEQLQGDLQNSGLLHVEQEIASKDALIKEIMQRNDNVQHELSFTEQALKATEDEIDKTSQRILAMQQETQSTERNRNDLREYLNCRLHPEDTVAPGGSSERSPSSPVVQRLVSQRSTSPKERGVSPPPLPVSGTAGRTARRAEFAHELHRRGFA